MTRDRKQWKNRRKWKKKRKLVISKERREELDEKQIRSADKK